MISETYPTASFDTLVEQAPLTADHYMSAAVRRIDARFGEGYASEHPDLVAAFMRVCAADFHSAILAKATGAGLDRIAAALERDV